MLHNLALAAVALKLALLGGAWLAAGDVVTGAAAIGAAFAALLLVAA